jgi:hypothetical protein
VVEALVLDTDALRRVGEVEPHGSAPPIVEHRVLNLGPGQAAQHEDEPKPRLHGRSRCAHREVDRAWQLRPPSRARVALG